MYVARIATPLIAALALWAGAAHAQSSAPVAADGVWVRASVQGQKATGAFMRLTAQESTRLVGVASPVAGVAEVHEMKMEGDVMKMRAIAGLEIPAGKSVELKPGGYHVMLMDLKQPLAKGDSVPLTLVFKNAQGVESKLELQAPVAVQGGTAPHGGGHGMPQHK